MEAEELDTCEIENTGEWAIVLILPNGELHHFKMDRRQVKALIDDLSKRIKYDA